MKEEETQFNLSEKIFRRYWFAGSEHQEFLKKGDVKEFIKLWREEMITCPPLKNKDFIDGVIFAKEHYLTWLKEFAGEKLT